MDNETREYLETAVRNGAAWLDENHPGWETKIDLSELNMVSCSSCVIGQAVGDYYQTISNAAADVDMYDETWSADNGFCSPSFDYDYKTDPGGYLLEQKESEYYRGLEERWTEEVKDRFNRGLEA